MKFHSAAINLFAIMNIISAREEKKKNTTKTRTYSLSVYTVRVLHQTRSKFESMQNTLQTPPNADNLIMHVSLDACSQLKRYDEISSQ